MSLEQELKELEDKQLLLIRESNTLVTEIKVAKQEIKTKEKRLSELRGGFHGHGEIRKVKAKAERKQREIEDQDKPKVVWCDDFWVGGYNYIVFKVTPKRIFVRTPGDKSTYQYNKDGTNITKDERCRIQAIDIEATFGGPCPESLK
jgi:hypothetical protein